VKPGVPRRARTDHRGRSLGGPVRVADALAEVAGQLGAGRAEVVGTLLIQWEKIVGPAVAAHIRPLRVEGTTLVVTADHPAWASEVRHLSAQILARVHELCGHDSTPTRIEVRVRR
jgi:predicted nucleic acid-binding Zn ribbon protein